MHWNVLLLNRFKIKKFFPDEGRKRESWNYLFVVTRNQKYILRVIFEAAHVFWRTLGSSRDRTKKTQQGSAHEAHKKRFCHNKRRCMQSKCVFIFSIFIFLWCNLGGTAINHFQWKHHNHFMLFHFSTEKQTKKTPCVPLTDKNNNWHFKMCTSHFIYAWNTWCMFVEHSISTLALSFYALSPAETVTM